MSRSLRTTTLSENFNSETVEMNEKKEELIPRDELREEFIPNINETQMFSLVDDIDIKPEELEVAFHHNSTLHSAPEGSLLNILHVDCGSDKADEKDLNHFYLDLLQCQRDCETCQKYLRILSEHVRAIHSSPQPIEDPLYIDPLNLDLDLDPPQAHQSSTIQIKSEIEEGIEIMEYSEQQESELKRESDPDFELGSESDHEYTRTPSTCLTQNSSQKGNLVKHTGETPFKCIVCKKSFTTKDSLESHKKIHTEERPYKCEMCEWRFKQSGDLKMHTLTHSEKYEYKYDESEKVFRRSAVLIEPKTKQIHSEETRFKCDESEKSFSSKSNLSRHKKSHTPEIPTL